MDGWARAGASLGEAMSGGPGGAYGKAYDEAMSRGHTLQKKLAEARIASDKMRAREDLDVKITELFADNPELGGAFSTMMRAGVGGNFDQLTRGGINIDRQSMLGAAREAAMSGDTATASMLAGLSRPNAAIPDQTKVAGNVEFNPTLAPDEQELKLTAFGAGKLQNEGEFNAGRVAAQMSRGAGGARSRSGGAGVVYDSPEAAYDAQLMKAAEGFLSDAKLKGRSVTGLNAKDVAYALRTNGEFRDKDGVLIGTWNVPMYDFNPPMAGASDGVRELLPGGPADAMAATAPARSPRDLTDEDIISGRIGPLTGPTPAQAMANESVADQQRAPRGAPVADPAPSRSQNAAQTQQVVIGGDVIGGPSISDLALDRGMAGAPAQASEPARGPARPTTEAEYNALPSGALFIDPDSGQLLRKP